jgi:hypothetical protein
VADHVEVVETLAPEAEICVVGDHVHQELDGKGLGGNVEHHYVEINQELGVVKLPEADTGNV